MKLEVGMYVRTKWGYICKIININDFREPTIKYAVEASYLKDIMFIGDDDISKASHNIIDIVQVGDYVNGMKVTRIGGTRWDKNDLHCYCEHNGDENWKQVMIPAKDIKSIVTKEAFKSMEYMLGDK